MNNQPKILLDIATRDVACLAADATISEAAQLMAQRRFSCIVVIDPARHPVGIVTERNILHAMRSDSPPHTPLHASMSAPVITLPGTTDCLDAYQLCMREGIRHLVLTGDDGAVAGIASETDFRLHLNLTALAGRRQVMSVAQHSVTSLQGHISLRQALNLMQTQRESCVVVVENDKPVGIVTERDVVRFYAREPERVNVPIFELMNSPVLTVPGNATIGQAAERLREKKVRHLAVVDADGRMVGLVNEHDLTQTMALGLLDEKYEVDELFLHTFIDTIPDVVWLKDKEGIYLACNHRFEMLVGMKKAQIVGKTDYDFASREQADFYRKNDRRAMAADKPSVNEEWLDFADGYRGLFEVIKTPMRDSQGRLIGVLGVARDITERESNERALQEREREFRTLAENLPDNVIRYDRECRVRYMNPAMLGSIAVELLPVVGKIPVESSPDSAKVRDLQRAVEQVMDSGERLDVETEVHHPDGSLHAHHVIFVPECDPKGVVTGALGIGRDITERKKREWQLSQLNFALDRIGEAMFVMDEEGHFLYVNEEGCRELGFPREELLGKLKVRDISANWSQEKWLRRWKYMEMQGTATFETVYRTREGRIFPVEISANYFEYEGHGYNMSLVRDITERKRVQSQLEDYRQRLEGLVVEESGKFRALVEQSLVGIFIVQDGFFRYVNPGLVDMFGFNAAEEIVDKVSFLRFIKAEDRAAVEETTRRLLAGEAETARLSFAASKRDGAPIIIDVHGRRIEFEGRPAIIGAQVDITEMRRSREELKQLVDAQSAKLQQSEDLLRTLIEAIPDAIQFKDGAGHWLESNSAARLTFGLDAQASRGKTDVELSEIAHPRYREALLQCGETDRQAWQAGTTSRVEETMQIPDVGTLTFDVIKVPLFHDDGSRKGLVIVGRDVSELKRAEEALRHSLGEYSELVQRIPVGIYKYRMHPDGSAMFDYVSPRWCELLDVTVEELRLDPQVALPRIHPDEVEHFARLNEAARNTLSPFVWEGRVCRKNGEIRWLHVESEPTLLENGDILWDGIQYDVTDRRKGEEALRVTASVFDNSQEAIVISDADNIIADVNLAFTHITGYSRGEAVGRNPKFLSSGRQDAAFYAAMWDALKQDKVWRGEIWNRRKNGEVYAELLSISAICDDAGQVQRYVGVFSDITYFKDYEAELSLVANYDALTGVPNRRLLADRLRQSVAHAQRGGKMLAICYIDLDGFKEVNDQHGHETGDRLLVGVARRLQEVLRAGDTLARLGGDEFVVLFNDLAEDAECFQILDRIMQTLAEPMQLDGHQVNVSASIGVTFYPADNEDGDTLLRHADQAMYIAKQTGKNRYHVYDAIHDQRVRTLHETRRRILQGLENGEFELYYQPKLELSSNKVVGAEALIRWNHPERGLLNPADFLPIIENSDMEIKLGKWVMGEALAQLQAWQQAGIAMDISINISARHLQSPDFVAELKRKLAQYPKLGRGRLQIEVLETAALEDMGQSFEVIAACREMGVSFALDDFGTGYSSLVYLRKLGADTLKIDQSFVQNMATNEGDHAIVQGVIALAKTFNRQTVAEGMEDPKLVQTLADMGCGYGQGYGIAYPMPAAEFLDWFKKR
ncbi:MAG: PAS domain S-box protein [Nitrosomonadales bacterium]|nr:PAS domain S-box protein [Nitrosomonadales bacterium]